MSNCVFGFPIYSDPSPLYTPVASGGGFVASLPVSNVLDRRLNRLARTLDATTTNTFFRVDLGVARPVGLIAILIPNVTKTSTPTLQWFGGTTPGGAEVYTSAALQIWPSGITAEDVTGPDGSAMNVWCVLIPPSIPTAQHWKVQITDTGNADGYVDVARVVIAAAYRPTNVDVGDGAKHQLRDDTVRTLTDGSSALYQAKRPYRSYAFSIDDFVDADAAAVRTMQRRLGKSGQFFWIPDVTDTTYGYQRNYLATLEELGALTANQGRTNGEFSVLEVV